MKIVIDLSEEDFVAIRDCHAKIGEDLFNLERNIALAIRNGIPLPKGHGRLVDADAYRKEMMNSREFDFFKILDMQPTIIDAE